MPSHSSKTPPFDLDSSIAILTKVAERYQMRAFMEALRRVK
jgi:hypothetical protein